MSRTVDIRVNGKRLAVEDNATVAAVLVNAGIWSFRVSVTGQKRGPLCGMGVCYECRVRIDGVPHRRACMRVVEPGMEVVTDG
ncbi:MAG TPA: (2Fe-2S)-binding protein [Longimicrobiales bacterium]